MAILCKAAASEKNSSFAAKQFAVSGPGLRTIVRNAGTGLQASSIADHVTIDTHLFERDKLYYTNYQPL